MNWITEHVFPKDTVSRVLVGLIIVVIIFAFVFIPF